MREYSNLEKLLEFKKLDELWEEHARRRKQEEHKRRSQITEEVEEPVAIQLKKLKKELDEKRIRLKERKEALGEECRGSDTFTVERLTGLSEDEVTAVFELSDSDYSDYWEKQQGLFAEQFRLREFKEKWAEWEKRREQEEQKQRSEAADQVMELVELRVKQIRESFNTLRKRGKGTSAEIEALGRTVGFSEAETFEVLRLDILADFKFWEKQKAFFLIRAFSRFIPYEEVKFQLLVVGRLAGFSETEIRQTFEHYSRHHKESNPIERALESPTESAASDDSAESGKSEKKPDSEAEVTASSDSNEENPDSKMKADVDDNNTENCIKEGDSSQAAAQLLAKASEKKNGNDLTAIITESRESFEAALSLHKFVEEFRAGEKTWEIFKGEITELVKVKLPDAQCLEYGGWYYLCLPIGKSCNLSVNYDWKSLAVELVDPEIPVSSGVSDKIRKAMSLATGIADGYSENAAVWQTNSAAYPGLENVDEDIYQYELYRIYSQTPQAVADRIVGMAEGLRKL